MIQIIDNIIPEYLQDHLEMFIKSKDQNNPFPLFLTEHLTEGKGKKKEIGFGSDFIVDGDLHPMGAPLLSPLYLFLNSQNLILKKLIRGRVFLQLPLYGVEKSTPQIPHTDLDFPHYSLIYYVTNSNGDTIFYNDNEEEIKRVSPKKGRILFFDGTIKHSGSYPTKTTRAIINYNFSGEFFGEGEKN